MNVGQILETQSRLGLRGPRRQVGEAVNQYLRKGDVKPLRSKLKDIYGVNETIQNLNDKDVGRTWRELAPRHFRSRRRCSTARANATLSKCSRWPIRTVGSGDAL